ncbi:MAG: alpha/beta fold hydrolase [Bradyrhizobium sp.]|uniref:lipase family alpha/beta hydrolase n=1 Tax=Bradyrhizobium sp. TaxID=376 RepID=UPI001D91477F|nr:alpha/beta fold hydrolase [Bradyrhizobium sp.]MBV9564797.1 alpha/beta fold hydrolase [Bradyrhizobium sp.]
MRKHTMRPASIDARRGGVVLLHGIAVGAWTLKRMERALRARGFATLNLDYASRKKPLDALADDIHPAVSDFARRLDGPLHFVGHSMGGLLARVYVAKYRPDRLGRVVMLGTPNGGSEIVDLLQAFPIYRWYFGPAGMQLATRPDCPLAALPALDYPVGIIAGNLSIYPISSFILPRPNDGRVSVASSKLAGMADHVTVRTVHSALPYHPAAIGQTIAFLSDGNFGLRAPTRFRSEVPGHDLAARGSQS